MKAIALVIFSTSVILLGLLVTTTMSETQYLCYCRGGNKGDFTKDVANDECCKKVTGKEPAGGGWDCQIPESKTGEYFSCCPPNYEMSECRRNNTLTAA